MLLRFSSKQWVVAIACIAVACFLYLFGLTRAGMLGPDEPRYAAIGRAMAQSGDWITPRLWGHPWFEKPALLYWLTALGFKAGLNQDLAPRLPVALLSVAFLVYFAILLRRDFGDRAAFYATTMLATSAGWLAFSHVAVTDLPMSVAFAAAMLAVLGGRSALLAGICLGFAVLAKGLVPLALFLPALWFWRKRGRDLSILLIAALIVAAPWYILVSLRNGSPFLEEFFWKHHFSRYVSGSLQHGQPFWFYVPVLAAGLFPWAPFFLLLFSKRLYDDRRVAFLLAWLGWGFIFFSASRNKLPGYLLPLLPAAAALMGVALAEARERSVKIMALVAASALLLGFVPAIRDFLPQALATGATRTHFSLPIAWIPPTLVVVLCCVSLERARKRPAAVGLIATLIIVSVVETVWQVYPVLDRNVSPRAFWLSHSASIACIPQANRSWRYGLDYYAQRDLSACN